MEVNQAKADDCVSTVSSGDIYHGNRGIQLSHRSTVWPLHTGTPTPDITDSEDTNTAPSKYQLLRIIAVISLPFGILIMLAVFYFSDSVSMTKGGTRLRDIMEQHLSRTFVNHLQTERFYSSLYLARAYNVNISVVIKAISDTDTALNRGIGTGNEAVIVNRYQYSISKLRQRVISSEIMGHECSEHYSLIIDSVVSDLIDNVKAVNVGRFSQAVAAYYYFLRYEEQFSIAAVIGALRFLNYNKLRQDLHYSDRITQCLKSTAFLEMSIRYSDTVEEAYRMSIQTYNASHRTYDILKEFSLNKNTTSRSSVELYTEWLNVTNDILTSLNVVLFSAETHLTEEIDIDISSSQLNTAMFALLASCLVCLTPVILYLFITMSVRSLDLSQDLRRQVKELGRERKRADTLLYQMLPREVADQLKQSADVSAVTFETVTIYFSEVENFMKICGESTPIEVVMMLNTLYRVLDSKVDEYDAYKVETINDAYMLASGLPKRNGTRHVYEICSLAIELRDLGMELEIPHRGDEKFKLKIGINTGPCAAGIVGSILPRYCLFGDTINTASRMESTSQASKIHLSPDTYEALREFIDEFHVESRGVVCVKGKGEMYTYWLLGKRRPDEEAPSVEIHVDGDGTTL